jgi:hypothetical protein
VFIPAHIAQVEAYFVDIFCFLLPSVLIENLYQRGVLAENDICLGFNPKWHQSIKPHLKINPSC